MVEARGNLLVVPQIHVAMAASWFASKEARSDDAQLQKDDTQMVASARPSVFQASCDLTVLPSFRMAIGDAF